MKRKYLSVLLATALVAATLAGCGSSTTQEATGSADQATTAETTDTAGAEAAGEAGAENVYRVLYSGEVTSLNYLITSNENEQLSLIHISEPTRPY